MENRFSQKGFLLVTLVMMIVISLYRDSVITTQYTVTVTTKKIETGMNPRDVSMKIENRTVIQQQSQQRPQQREEEPSQVNNPKSQSRKKRKKATTSHGQVVVVTSLNNIGNECRPDPTRPLQKVLSVYENYSNISQILRFPSKSVINDETKTKLLVCPFSTNQPHFNHFAHAMQQLYGCYSFYQQQQQDPEFSSNNNKSQRNILIIPSKIKNRLGTNPFLLGFFSFLQDGFNVEFLDSMESIADMEYTSPAETFREGGYIMTHTFELNQQMEKYLSLSSSMEQQIEESSPRDQDEEEKNDKQEEEEEEERRPRIAILNRRPSVGRSIRNIDKIVDALLLLLRSGRSYNEETVLVEYFEDKTFVEQIEFFHHIDILISPHGAQNTGIPFLSNKKCSHVLELFPNHYLLPTFYGSLARNSGIGYSYLYMSPTPSPMMMGEEQQQNNNNNNNDSSVEMRIHARATNFCLDPTTIVDSVASIVDDWRECRKQS